MTKAAKPTPRGAKVWRVEITEYINGRKTVVWIEPGQPDKHGRPTRGPTSLKSPEAPWTRKEAMAIASGFNKGSATGTRLKAVALAVRDDKPATDLALRMPDGAAA